ncbi:MAG: Ig-like domain-containing protein, partial [Lachnospiraceae bacterium]|nr:Ig-like domain-containing protein [Lachnospiraceae bacterium]
LYEGKSTTLTVKKGSKKVSGVKWSTSNKKVATVSSKGKVTAKKKGTATITAKVSKKSYKCKVTVKAKETTSGFDFKRDCTVTTGSVTKHIEFEINKENVTEEELKEQGYDVSDGVASKDTVCDTVTYSFKKLPKNLAELKKIPLNTKFGPMAAGICALTTYETLPSAMYTHPIFDMFDYINGPKFEVNNAQKSGIFYSMKATLEKGKYCYFNGAKPSNSYTPDQPYTFTVYEGPYYIPARDHDINYGTTPERRMILIAFEGDDSERYMDVFESSDGNWYCWDTQWQHLVAGIKDVTTAW